MLRIEYGSRFKKDYKLMVKRGNNKGDLEKVLRYLVNEQPLPAKYRDHWLSGNYSNCRECHINPDWLLIYKMEKDTLILTLIRNGTHNDLF